MQSEKVKFWNSVVSRFGLFFIALIVFALFLSGYLVYSESASVITEFSKERIKHTSNLATQSFYSLLDEATKDIALMSENPVIQDFVEEPNEKNTLNLKKLFEATLRHKSSYYQVRLLSTKEEGMELIRFDKLGSSIYEVPRLRLQRKGDKNYFQETITLERGEYYFSEINLNEEFGTVSVPLTSTLRTASPIYNSHGEISFVLIININLEEFYFRLHQIMQTDIKILIIDDKDQYLFAPNMTKCFGSQLLSNESFDNDFDKQVSQLIGTSKEFDLIQTKDGYNMFYHMKELTYFQNNRKVYLFSIMDESMVLKSAFEVRNKGFSLVAGVCLVALILALIFTRIFSKRIIQITTAISKYEEGGELPTDLQTHRQDEIGLLARTFSNMRLRIDQQIEALKISLTKEQKAIRERDEFLQNMGHELRTPLNSILGLTQLLRKNKPTEEQKPIIDSMQRSATNLSGLMYDVLDHQKLVEGKVTIKYTPCNINTLLSDIYASYQFEAINKGLKFTLEVDDSLKKQRYLMDAMRLSQVVTNLVVNAIKYTERGIVILRGKLQNGQLSIAVEDTGVGILSENLERINERFYQENEGIIDRAGGYGLGLSIVKQLVGLFGGELTVTSQKDKGSVFSVELPLTETTNKSQENIDTDDLIQRPTLNGNYAVLHIEDDLSTRQLIAYLLNIEEISLQQCITLNEAQAYLQKNTPQLIISDLMLEHHHIGAELKRIIGQLYPTPVLVISAFDPDEMKGVSEYFMQKPVDLNLLQDWVYVLIKPQEFDQPQLENTYSQYDHNTVLIKNFLGILINEFESYVHRIDHVFGTKDETEWNAISHKIVTHIRSMQLDKLSCIWPKRIGELDQDKLINIRNSLLYNLCCFRVQLAIRSTN